MAKKANRVAPASRRPAGGRIAKAPAAAKPAGGGGEALSPEQRDALLDTLQSRFEKHMRRHPGLAWEDVAARLIARPAKLWSLHEMERTGGEPDVVGRDAQTGEYLFYDCSAESPAGRRSVAYDRAGQAANIKGRPDAPGNAVDLAAAMGAALLTEAEYRALQKLGEFDTKTSSWVQTPPEIRTLGGALFCDCRYGQVFVYHNGAQSYYGARGFRGVVRV